MVRQVHLRFFAAAVPATLAVIAVGAAPLWRHHPVLAWAIGQFFSFVCHQDPARSFWIAGAPVAVCARCLGIYVGAMAGAWVRMAHARALRLAATMAAVNTIDVLTEVAGLHGNWMAARFAFGAAFGAALAAVVVAAMRYDSSAVACLDPPATASHGQLT